MPRRFVLRVRASAHRSTNRSSIRSAGRNSMTIRPSRSVGFHSRCGTPARTTRLRPGPASNVVRRTRMANVPSTTWYRSSWCGWTCAMGTPPPGVSVNSNDIKAPAVSPAVRTNAKRSPVTRFSRLMPSRAMAVGVSAFRWARRGHAAVQVDGAVGHGAPGEPLQDAPAAGRTHFSGPIRVGDELVDPGGEVRGESRRIRGLAGPVVARFDRDQEAGHAVFDDLRDAAGG